MATLLAERSRRKNDGLEPVEGDTLFAAEVKRIARARGFTARALARAIERHHSVLIRQLSDSKKTQDKTADMYARALSVPELYLRLLARDRVLDAEIVPCVDAIRKIFAEGSHALRADACDAVWCEIWTHLLDPERRVEADACLRVGYLHDTRIAVDRELGIDEQRDSFRLLVITVKPLGIDVESLATPVDDGELARLWIALIGTMPHGDVVALVAHYRTRLKKRRHFRPAMDAVLKKTIRQPRLMLDNIQRKDHS